MSSDSVFTGPCSKLKSKSTKQGLLAIALWSASVAITREVTEDLGPVFPAVFIYFLGFIIIYLIEYKTSNPFEVIKNFSFKYLFICGLLFSINMLVFYLAIGVALDYQALLGVGLTNYLWPTLTIVFSMFIFKNKASKFIWLGMLIASIGIFFVVTHQDVVSLSSFVSNINKNKEAYLLALLAAVTWALFSNYTKALKLEEQKERGKEKSAVPFFMFFSTLLFLIASPFFLPETYKVSIGKIFGIVFLAFSNSLGYIYWDKAMRHGNEVLVVSASYFIPLFSTLCICVCFQIVPGVKLWLGCVMIILGAYISNKSLMKL